VNDLHDGPLHGASLDLSGKVGPVGAAIVAIIGVDFFLWLSHFLRHKIPPLWRFHQVHHAQTQISPLTDKRFHFIEPLMFVAIAIIPVALLGLNIGGTQLIALALIYATGFTHANLRWNAGALGWLFVTPQSHRVHHSTEERHWEQNFGAVLSIWDRMFGTQWHGIDDYPTIGIDDTAFPLERKAGPAPVVHNYFRQVVYPFKRVAADVRKS
jgi:sterol desaturase/sphingolipid hydroxylase (fatty acid hydroxylase superfamily)